MALASNARTAYSSNAVAKTVIGGMLISRMTSNPFKPGISMSRNSTAGACSVMRSNAARPFAASPTTSTSGWADKANQVRARRGLIVDDKRAHHDAIGTRIMAVTVPGSGLDTSKCARPS